MVANHTETFEFRQVDVFTERALGGNPLAVVIGADNLSDAKMAAFANWTNLSETTFLLKPTQNTADYRVRIFTPSGELPFAGHPTLGSCHVWQAITGHNGNGVIIQECAAGLIRIRAEAGKLSFAAPALIRSGAVEPALLQKIAKGLHIAPEAIIDSSWVDNGPGWLALLLKSREDALALQPDFAALSGLRVGIVAPCTAGDDTEADFEVRAFTAAGFEDPATGSLNAGIAQWLINSGITAKASYIASQGTVLGRSGRIYAHQEGNDIWIGGNVITCIEGTATL